MIPSHIGIAILAAGSLTALAQTPGCDLSKYSSVEGLTAAERGGAIELGWQGERGDDLRARFAIREGQPVVQELAARKGSQGEWVILGRNLTPEFQVTTGIRRLSEQQMAPLRELGVKLTPEVVEREKWSAFWDAPLSVPGKPGANLDLPRKAEEIGRSWASYRTNACAVRTDGARLELSFNGVELGIFAGRLQFTVYRGSNLVRAEVIAKTEQPSVAYKYIAGLKGFAIANQSELRWRDTARAWQQYRFGGTPNRDPVGLRARSRVLFIGGSEGSLSILPPPHKFFFAREMETNLGYVYYRKQSDGSFAAGVRQPDREEGYKPYGISDEVWDRRVGESRGELQNFALYNAPAGTWQRMALYLYLSAEPVEATEEHVLAYTHHDTYPALAGFQVLVSHFHFHFNEQLRDAGTLDQQPTWLPVFKALGINIAILADFHSDSHPADTGLTRLNEQKTYFEGCARFSDRDFLLIPGEEPDANFGGHYMFVFPHSVYFTHLRKPAEPTTGPFREQLDPWGTVYHTVSAGTELDLLRRENGLVWQTHPRTKGSAGYPDATRTTDFFNSAQFLGGSFQSLPVDQSERRLCQARCLALLDDMNNWSGPKYMIAEGDTYMKYPDDETYPQLAVNYVKLPSVPRFEEGWQPVLTALRDGNYFVTTGEVLIKNWSVSGSGQHRTYNADANWTFPPEFAELVWGDGKSTGREIISLTRCAPMSNLHFAISFNGTGKKWVRFAIWDSAGNGAFTQPVHLK